MTWQLQLSRAWKGKKRRREREPLFQITCYVRNRLQMSSDVHELSELVRNGDTERFLLGLADNLETAGARGFSNRVLLACAEKVRSVRCLDPIAEKRLVMAPPLTVPCALQTEPARALVFVCACEQQLLCSAAPGQHDAALAHALLDCVPYLVTVGGGVPRHVQLQAASILLQLLMEPAHARLAAKAAEVCCLGCLHACM